MEKKGFKQFLCSPIGKVLMIVVFYTVIFGLMLLATELDIGAVGALLIGVVCGYFGWKTLNRMTPDVFLVMSFMGWAIYFLVKGFLSIFIGIFVAPFYISKKIVNLIEEEL